MNCRHCHTPLEQTFLDLGHAPPSNAYLTAQKLSAPELYFPLKLRVCTTCWLVQTEDYARADELFNHDYAYFSSTSTSWLDHAARYTSMITNKLELNANSLVIEVASNDGYLLKNFVAAGIPCLGIEPTASTAEAAEKLGIPVMREFFSLRLAEKLAAQGEQADLILGNNVFAHVPDINDFAAGLKAALKPGGVITLEFPHLMRLIEGIQFDTVYHEHFSYLSLHTVQRILEQAGLRIWDVEELPTHGGSLRVYACHQNARWNDTAAVDQVLEKEKQFGICNLSTYQGFQAKADAIKNDLLSFLLDQKKAGRVVVGYGAAAKGNTLLNYAGVKPDLLPYVCDAAPSKQGKFLPGSHITVVSPGELSEQKPDYLLILPWNIADEVIAQHSYIREWGGQFVTAVPRMHYS
ncbi:MAG: class I SAM-dependent methyltransferase [Desulfuromonadales bacterium]|nr:MAG: class I SAM-dependent methyltransferase [Desulfuromonadales bacterium]